MTGLVLGWIGVWTLGAGAAVQTPPPPAAIGTVIDNLTFKDIRYLPRSLDDFKDKKALVLAFVNTSCPVGLRYFPKLNRLEQKYRSQGVQFLGVFVAPEDAISHIATLGVELRLELPLVKDFTGDSARKVGVTTVPEVVVLDAERRLRYRGRIDDQYRVAGSRSEPTRNDLVEALEDVLAGRPVRVATTPVDGCPITWPTEVEVTEPVNYADHVAPILRKHCIECHRPDTAAPFALLNYRQVVNRAKVLAEVVREERMPPWYASPSYGHFANRRGLSEQEKATILAWVKAGMPSGDEAKLPPLPPEIVAPKSRWLIGEPDLVLTTAKYDIPAEGTVEYKYAIMPYVFTQDTWLEGVQILPENPKVVHHANLAYLVLGDRFRMENFITGFVPGGDPMKLDPGIAFKIPKGSVVGLQIHFVTTGQPQTGQLKVGFRYARSVVQKQLHFMLFADRRFAIPPGAPAHRVEVSKTLARDVDGLALFSHMHLRGRDMSFIATRPEGKTETLLVIPNYNFDWQMPYRWVPGTMRLPKGTKLDCVAHYDNSAFNAFNPDPKATVRDGQQTEDEMMNGFFFYTYSDEKLNLRIDPKTGAAMP
jgi:thiol-disulfide isomerase/thioredoxin/mono/diheme cytochrome c family protein